MSRLAMIIAVSLTARTALAQPDASFAEGQRLYKLGEYARAAEQFQAAYAIEPDPSFLFNIGQAYRLANRCAEAASYYRLYLERAADAPNVDKVGAYIEKMDACTPRLEPVPSPPQVPEVVAPLPSIVPPPLTTRVDVGTRRRRAGTALVAGGVVALGAAAWFTYDVHILERNRGELCAQGCDWTPDRSERDANLASRGRRASIAAISLYSVAGAAIASGVLVYLTGRDRFQVVVTPSIERAAVSASFTW